MVLRNRNRNECLSFSYSNDEDKTPTAGNSTSVNTTGTNPSETTTPYRVPSGATLPLDCETSGELRTIAWGNAAWNFELTCNGVRRGGETTGFRSYSLSDCLMACIKLNSLWGDKACTAATFDTNLDSVGGTNCFLKNVTIAKKDVVVQKGAVLAVLEP